MNPTAATPPPGSPGRVSGLLPLGLFIALLVLAATLVWSALNLRLSATTQIANRVGETLDSVAAAQYLEDQLSGEALTNLNDPTEQFQIALKVSRLHDVIGVRLFSPQGKFINAFPVYINDAQLPSTDLSSLQKLKPVTRYLSHAHLEQQELLPDTNAPVPLLLAEIPLRTDDSSRLAGVIQFIMSGSGIAGQYAALDRQLIWQFLLAFLVAGGILSTGLLLAFGRLQHANRLLAERTAHLVRANHELTLAAKTSAVGAVTTFLVHGLKNPLGGLQNFVRERGVGNGQDDEEEWRAAAASTQRMQDLINRVVGVLREQSVTSAVYEITFPELAEMLTRRVEPAARAPGVKWETMVIARGSVTGRDADLILLILENLAQNALDATPAGKLVRCSIFNRASCVVAQISDEGPGLPPAAVERLFLPCISSKQNGSGIGLAISQQLAKHLGAELSLASSTSHGTCFELVLPPAPALPGSARSSAE